jgi:hypothetical protein
MLNTPVVRLVTVYCSDCGKSIKAPAGCIWPMSSSCCGADGAPKAWLKEYGLWPVKRPSRADAIPPDGWVTEIRKTFNISLDATWEDILIELAQTKRHADRVTDDFVKSQARSRATERLRTMNERRVTDDNCKGYCRCPTCGGPAHWSFPYKVHGCADPECRTEFREHDDTQLTANGEEDSDG